MQSDVETVHNLIEMDFYEIESDSFKNRLDFMKKAYSYQLFFNLHRPNTYKENKTPWELARQKKPDLDRRLLMLPPIDLDAMIRLGMPFCAQGGNDLLTVPLFRFIFISIPKQTALWDIRPGRWRGRRSSIPRKFNSMQGNKLRKANF